MARRILLVDDDIAAIATVRRALSREGLQVLLATSAADGMVALAHHDPEVVLLAPSLEGGRGVEVREAISRDRRRDRMVVLLLGDGQGPAFAGDPVFEKPVDSLAVLAAIRSQFPGEVGSEMPSWTMDEPGDSAPDLPPEEPGPEEEVAAGADPDAPAFFGGSPWAMPPSALKRTDQARAEAQERIRRIAEEARAAVEEKTRRAVESTADAGSDADITGEMMIPPGLRAALARADDTRGLLDRTMVGEGAEVTRPRADVPQAEITRPAPTVEEADTRPRPEPVLPPPAPPRAPPRPPAPLAATREELLNLRAEVSALREELAQSSAENGRLSADLTAVGDRAARLQAQLDSQAAEHRTDQDVRLARLQAEVNALTEVNTRLQAQEASASEALALERAAGVEGTEHARVEAAQRAETAIAAAREEAEAAAREAIEKERAISRRDAVEAISRAREEVEGRVREAESGARAEADARIARAQKDLEARAREAVETSRGSMQEKARRALAEAASTADERLFQARAEAAAELNRLRTEMESQSRKALEEARTQGARAVEELRGASEVSLRKAVEEARRGLDRARAAGEEKVARARADAEVAAFAAAEDKARLESDLTLARGVADELHARGEELRRRVAALETALEAAAAGARRAETDAARRLEEETIRAAALARREAEEQLRREAQGEAERRAETRRQAMLELRRAPVAGLPPPSALLDTLRQSGAEGLPMPTSVPVGAPEEPEVELPAGPLPPDGLFGDAGRLLARLWRDGTTGRLDLELAGGRRTLWLEEGRIAGAHSDAPGERLEDVALQGGLITREQRAWARTAPAAGARQLAALLTERGYLKAAELVPLVRRRVAEIAFVAFERDGGRYVLSAEPVDPEERVAMPEGTLSIVAEGIRRKYVAERLHRKLGGPGTLLRPTGAAAPEELGLSTREKKLVALADGLRTLDELILDAGVDETFALRALWAAVVAGVLEVAVRGLPPAEEGGALDRLRIQEKARQAREADYFELLGLPRGCTAYEVDEAYERLAHEFSVERHVGLGDPGVHKLLGEIQSVLGEARDVLRDDRLRADYGRSLPGV